MSDFINQLKINLGKKVKERRRSMHLSMTELYKLTGVSSSTINDIEHYKYLPSINNLYSLSKGLNLSLSELLDIVKTENEQVPRMSLLAMLRAYGLSEESSQQALSYIEYLKK